MSYILDALRKSEQSHNQDRIQAPVAPVTLPPADERVNIWPALLGTVILVNLIGVGYVLYERYIKQIIPQANVTQTAAPQVTASPVFEDPPPEPRNAPSPQPHRPTPIEIEAIVDPIAAPDITFEDEQAAIDLLGEAEDFLIHEAAITPSVLPPEDAVGEMKKALSKLKRQRRPPPAQPKEPVQPLQSDALPTYAQLPFAVREQLPNLRLTIHIYAKDPKASKVYINNRRMREGESNKNLKLERIIAQGAILSFKGEQFILPK